MRPDAARRPCYPAAVSETSRARRPAVPIAPAAALAAAAGFALLRLVLAPTFELLPQSAYYFTAYAEHPALSYYDHPPMIGYLLRAGAELFGRTSFGVHFTLWLTTVGTQVAFFWVARRYLDQEGGRERGAFALTLFASTTMVSLLSFVAVPDVPLLLFWTLAVGALDRALLGAAPGEEGAGPAPPRPGAWTVAGLAMGLALLSKYTALYLQGGLVLFLLLSRRHRRLLATPWPYVSLALAHLVCLPVYLWNARHGFASFLFQSTGRAAEIRFDPGDLVGFLAGQAVVLLPVLFAAFLVAAWREVRRRLRPGGGAPEPKTLLLLCLSLPLFATCVGLSPFAWVKMNWAMPAYVAGVLLAARAVGRRAWRWHLATAVVVHLLLAVELVAFPLLPSNEEAWFGWDELAARAEARAAAHPGAFVFAGDNYRTTAELRFYGPRHGLTRAYGMDVIGWNALGYEYLGEDLATLAGRDAIFLRSEALAGPSAETGRYLAQARRYFARVREVEPIEIHRHGRVVRRFRVFFCTAYRGPDATPPGGGVPFPPVGWEGDRGVAGGIRSTVPFPPVGWEGDRGVAGGIH